MELEVTWGRALRVWWALFWRTLIYGLGLDIILVIIAMAIIGLVYGVDDIEGNFNNFKPMLKVAGYIINALLGIYIIRIVLKRGFKQFKIVIISKAYSAKLDITNKIALKVWWAYFWRSVIYSFLVFATLVAVVEFLFPLLKVYDFGKIIVMIICIIYIGIFFFMAPYIMQVILKKDFRVFRIALLANENSIENKVNA